MERHRRHPVLVVDRHPMHGDRRRTGASMTDSNNGGVALGLDLLPGSRVIPCIDT
jgi:hypothetical protein